MRSTLQSVKSKYEEQNQKAEELQEEVATKAAFNGEIEYLYLFKYNVC